MYDSGTVFEPSVLDVTDDDLRARFMEVSDILIYIHQPLGGEYHLLYYPHVSWVCPRFHSTDECWGHSSGICCTCTSFPDIGLKFGSVCMRYVG